MPIAYLKTAGLVAILLTLAAATGRPAAAQVSSATVSNAPAQPFPEWLSELRAEAARRGISEAILVEAIDPIEPIPRVIELDRNQPEFTLTFKEYLNRVAPDHRIATGRRKLAQNRPLLDAVARTYGVPPHVIVALWAIETDFGRLTGGFEVVPALATLAHDGRRSAFFRSQLFDALTILDEGHIAPSDMVGSWAGAMGQCQFMPSSFLSFAVDRDGDGRKDIWNNRADIFASAANLLASNGWERGWTWGRPVRLPDVFDLGVEGLDTRKPLAEWQALGIRRIDGRNLPRADIEASLLMPDGPDGPVFLVYNNFRVILSWNRSDYFALTVGFLADRIAGKNTIMFAK
ncbi:MAG: lytic murein transglycosylase [Rhodospirillales bacterium]|nr:MAG: lytic murein transglycosylase [Rhodospirillales bacterium]